MNITKLVLPVAGRGKRLRPLTLKTPKNLICVNGKPLLEYGLEEAVQSGIKDVILVVNPAHRKKFEQYIKEKGRRRFPGLGFHIREQETPGGNGHAIVKAYDLLEGEPFAVRFCDDVIVEKKPALASLIEIFKICRSPVLLLERVPKNLVSRFGVVGAKRVKSKELRVKSQESRVKGKESRIKSAGGKIYQITKIIEKPAVKDAPSNLTIVGGYILTPSILRNLKNVADTLPVVADDALPLAVALQIELIVGGKVYGWEFPGMRLDCGTLEKLRRTEELLKKFNRKS
jgi:UTP--glucose-1-phosphate uridylyltransferase